MRLKLHLKAWRAILTKPSTIEKEYAAVAQVGRPHPPAGGNLARGLAATTIIFHTLTVVRQIMPPRCGTAAPRWSFPKIWLP